MHSQFQAQSGKFEDKRDNTILLGLRCSSTVNKCSVNLERVISHRLCLAQETNCSTSCHSCSPRTNIYSIVNLDFSADFTSFCGIAPKINLIDQ